MATMTSGITTPIGDLLREWRERRRLSQLALALEAEVSTRHLSFLETGRARPSREMLLRLTERLEVSLRERNTMLLAAGFAPAYPERDLDDPALGVARAAIELGPNPLDLGVYPVQFPQRARDVAHSVRSVPKAIMPGRGRIVTRGVRGRSPGHRHGFGLPVGQAKLDPLLAVPAVDLGREFAREQDGIRRLSDGPVCSAARHELV